MDDITYSIIQQQFDWNYGLRGLRLLDPSAWRSGSYGGLQPSVYTGLNAFAENLGPDKRTNQSFDRPFGCLMMIELCHWIGLRKIRWVKIFFSTPIFTCPEGRVQKKIRKKSSLLPSPPWLWEFSIPFVSVFVTVLVSVLVSVFVPVFFLYLYLYFDFLQAFHLFVPPPFCIPS